LISFAFVISWVAVMVRLFTAELRDEPAPKAEGKK
jgi:hypothetical protein